MWTDLDEIFWEGSYGEKQAQVRLRLRSLAKKRYFIRHRFSCPTLGYSQEKPPVNIYTLIHMHIVNK